MNQNTALLAIGLLLLAAAYTWEHRTDAFNPSALSKEQYISMSPEQRDAYDLNNAERLASEGVITKEQAASIKATIEARA